VFDDGLAVFSKGPRSYTGEDTLEVHLHGNPLLVQRLIAASVKAGARLANPGEFTQRALLAGKVDLVAAEAVDQLCRATAQAGIDVARAGMGGPLADFYAEVRAELVIVAAELEARLDYPSDELAFQDDDSIVLAMQSVAGRARALADTQLRGRVSVDGARVAIVGTVNAGKSSLFNALLGRERALVHSREGTTRDVIEVRTAMGGLAITLLDTAGERATTDPIESAGMALARSLTAEADLLLVVLRARPSGPSAAELAILDRTAGARRLLVCNGVDAPHAGPDPRAIQTVATTGKGVDRLRKAIVDQLLAGPTPADGLIIASARQADLLCRLAACCDEAVEALPMAGVAVCADAIVRGVEIMDELTGADTREAVLDGVFARFCIGK